MRVTLLERTPPAELALRLAEFEAEFTYPLGSGRRFRISHGDDYVKFFASMGRAACFVAREKDQIIGALACVIRRLSLPGGGERDAAYLADLKVTSAARSGMTLYRLARAGQAWVRAYTDTAFAVVMEGTQATPDRYTGRAGIPAFVQVARIAVLRVPTGSEHVDPTESYLVDREVADSCARALTLGRYRPAGGDPSERSEFLPEWLCSADRSACGRLEDTRRAKRLIALGGEEIVSAHLSSFAFRSPDDGASLIREACRRAHLRGFPALFVAVMEAEAPAILASLGHRDITVAPAGVYATGLPPGAPWIVNTAEI